MQHRTALTSLVALGALALVLALAACEGLSGTHWVIQGDGIVTRIQSSGSTRHTTIEVREDGDRTELETSGAIAFTDDDAAVASLSPDGYLRIRSDARGRDRTIDVTPAIAGEPGAAVLVYRVEGSEQPLDAEGRALLARVVEMLVTRTSIGAKARAERIAAESGADGLLAEIERLHSSDAQRIYFGEALRAGELDADQLVRAAKAVSHVTSSSTRGDLLTELAQHRPADTQLSLAILDTADGIPSTSARGNVIEAVARYRRVDAPVAHALIRSARSIPSSSTSSASLVTVLGAAPRVPDEGGRELLDPGVIEVWIEAVSSIPSTSAQGRAFRALLAQSLRPTQHAQLVRAFASIPSTSTRTELLCELLRVAPADPGVLAASLDTIWSIPSSSSQERALGAVVAAIGDADQARLPRADALALRADLARGAGRIASSSTRTEFLVRLLRTGPTDDAVLIACLDAIASTPSSSNQERALRALLERHELSADVLAHASKTASAIASSSARADLQELIVARLLVAEDRER